MNLSWQHKRQVEEAALNAWPALNVVLYDGWLLRFAKGYTKRANSVNGFYDGSLDVEEKIDHCQALYRERGLPAIFRLTPFCQPAELDGRLQKRGYQLIDRTLVELLVLDDRSLAMAEGMVVYPVDKGTPTSADERGFMVDKHVSYPRMMVGGARVISSGDGLSAWLDIFHALNPGRRDSRTHEQILRQVVGKMGLMVYQIAGEIVACGLAVVDGDYLGLFDIVTAAGQRRKGYARRLTQSLLAWGMDRGARFAYLQVMENNMPARQLYAGLGFEDIYSYWYRIQTPGS